MMTLEELQKYNADLLKMIQEDDARFRKVVAKNVELVQAMEKIKEVTDSVRLKSPVLKLCGELAAEALAPRKS